MVVSTECGDNAVHTEGAAPLGATGHHQLTSICDVIRDATNPIRTHSYKPAIGAGEQQAAGVEDPQTHLLTENEENQREVNGTRIQTNGSLPDTKIWIGRVQNKLIADSQRDEPKSPFCSSVIKAAGRCRQACI